MTITEYLIEKYRFQKCSRDNIRELDIDRFSCVVRIHDIHYLYYSEQHKHFTLSAVNKKHGPAGQFDPFIDIMIPRAIYTPEDADKTLEGVVDLKYLKIYNP